MNAPNPHAAEFSRCLVDLDVAAASRLWAHVNPHLPQPKNDREMLILLHLARTQAGSVRFKLRAYSHQWLTDQGYPSQLPDELRPKAERMYPVVKSAVGISVNARRPEMKPLADAVHSAMSNAVLEAYEDRVTDPEIIKASMMRARKKTVVEMLGR